MQAAAIVFLVSVLSSLALSQQQVCGAPLLVSPNGKGYVVGCPGSTTSNSCTLSLSFITCLEQSTNPKDPAIFIKRDDVVTWYSDQNGLGGKPLKLRFRKFKEVQADSIHHEYLECGTTNGDPGPFTDDFGEGPEKYTLRKASVAREDDVLGTCFKHDIWVREDGATTEHPVDPHVIIGDATQYVFLKDFKGQQLKDSTLNQQPKK